MKQKIKKTLDKPKIFISSALVVAIIAAVIISVIHRRNLAEQFAGLPSATSTVATNYGPQDLTLAFPIGGRIKTVSVKIGDTVKAGTILASLDSQNAIGAVTQARAAYSSAQTAYTKLVNGASDPEIVVAKVALNNAKNAYDNVVSQQKTVVANALSAMMNSSISAVSTVNGANAGDAPIITGTYSSTEQGIYTITTYGTGNGSYFSVSGLETANGPVSTAPVQLGTRGLFIQFPSDVNISNTWKISIPNTQSSVYLANQNAYKLALQNQSQLVAIAQGAVDAAQAALDQKLAGARSEDLAIAKAQVESTRGALQIAEGTYSNTVITAPVDGTITNVSITAGQIATPNTPAIELLSK